MPKTPFPSLPFTFLGLSVLTAVLSACQQSGTPLSAAILTPASNAVVSGTTAVQVSVPDGSKVSTVRVYARGAGEKGTGVLLGTANKAPYVVSWATSSTPNGSGLELYAVAEGPGGSPGTSDAVPVSVSNPDAPTLNYLVTYNLPPDASAAGTASSSSSSSQALRPLSVPPRLDARAVRPAADVQVSGLPITPLSPAIHPLTSPLVSASPRNLAVEWAWSPVSGAGGYDVLLSRTSLAGPYTLQRSQLAVPTGVQKFSQTLTDAAVGNLVYGAVATLSNATQSRSSLSNAGAASFLDEQPVASPTDGQPVADGRPILTWNALPGADAYLYFL